MGCGVLVVWGVGGVILDNGGVGVYVHVHVYGHVRVYACVWVCNTMRPFLPPHHLFLSLVLHTVFISIIIQLLGFGFTG